MRYRFLIALLIPIIAFWHLSPFSAQERGQGVRPQTSVDGLSGRRVALVVGNGRYASSPLTNPPNDAREMAKVLRSLRFDVIEVIDQNKAQMRQAIRQFGEKLGSGEGNVGLFYFAGHGVQVNGKNYLIPVGADVTNEAEAEDDCVNVDLVLVQMRQSRRGLNIVILDACRNNPFRGWRSGDGGLAFVNAPRGTLIAYATAPGRTAADGRENNSPYTGALLKHITAPNVNLLRMFELVRAEVERTTNGAQTPWESTSVTNGSEFYLAGKEELRPAFDPRQIELEYWNGIKNSRNAADFRSYLSRYPNGEFRTIADSRIAELERKPEPPVLTAMIPLPRHVKPASLSMLTFSTAKVDDNGRVARLAGTPTQQYTEDLGGGVKLEMVAVKGSANIQDFWMGKYEVTQAQWKAVMGTDPSKFKGDRLPVEQVSWEDAQEFCRRLNAKLGLNEGEGYQLPKEAEWEYAARAGTTTEYAFGNTISPEIVNYDGNYPAGNAPKGIYREKTVEVGSLGAANQWGLYDMHGNVWEWCEDRGDTAGSYRVIRGGGWFNIAVICRSANRIRWAPGNRSDNLGFRLVRIGR